MLDSEEKKTRSRLLVICNGYPYPPDSGTCKLIYYKLRALAKHLDVFLLCAGVSSEEKKLSQKREALLEFCEEVYEYEMEFQFSQGFWGGNLQKIFGTLLWRNPIFVRQFYSRSAAELLENILRKHHIDVVNIEYLYIFSAFEKSSLESVQLIASEHNVEHDKHFQEAFYLKNWVKKIICYVEAFKLKRLEKKLYPKFNKIIFISEKDKEYYETVSWNKNLFSAPALLPESARKKNTESPIKNQIIFSGTLWYFPNEDAVRFLCDRIMPIVWKENPDVRLVVTGEPTKKILKIAKDNRIEFTGYLEREALFDLTLSSDMIVSPLRYGSGIKLKIIEGMSLGMPIVATSKSVEGVKVENERDVLVADDAKTFASAILRITNDPNLRKRLSQNAAQTFSREYESDVAIEKWLPILKK